MAKGLSKLERDAFKRFQDKTRRAVLKVMNDLASISPDWSGRFRSNWAAYPLGYGGTRPTIREAIGMLNAKYPYTLRDVPMLGLTVKQLNRRIKFDVYNYSPYAPYAMDLLPGKFYPPKDQPEPRGEIVATGSRPGPGFRGEVSGEGGGISTAERDWYVVYAGGGALAKSYQQGFRLSVATPSERSDR